jgi:hypothetical protein
MRGILRSAALLVAAFLVLGCLAGLSACGGSGGTTTVTTTVTSQARARHHPAPVSVPNGAPRDRRLYDRLHFHRDAPRELRSVAACLTGVGFGAPTLHPHDNYSGIPYASATVDTAAGGYGITIWRTGHQAFAYAYQQTSFPGASTEAVHGSYQGRVALVTAARDSNGMARRGAESHAYYVERSAAARCAYSIPAATGRPAYVY